MVIRGLEIHRLIYIHLKPLYHQNIKTEEGLKKWMKPTNSHCVYVIYKYII